MSMFETVIVGPEGPWNIPHLKPNEALIGLMSIPNPFKWYYADTEDSEYWGGKLDTREEVIAVGRERYSGLPFWICEANNSMPSFDIFDAEQLTESVGGQDCWSESGFEGFGELDKELEQVLAAAFRKWWIDRQMGTGWTFGTTRVSEQITSEAV